MGRHTHRQISVTLSLALAAMALGLAVDVPAAWAVPPGTANGQISIASPSTIRLTVNYPSGANAVGAVISLNDFKPAVSGCSLTLTAGGPAVHADSSHNTIRLVVDNPGWQAREMLTGTCTAKPLPAANSNARIQLGNADGNGPTGTLSGPGGTGKATGAQFMRMSLRGAPSRAELNTIACSSASWCFAIGGYSPHTGTPSLMLAERWNGKSWKKVAAPTPPGAAVQGVSCDSGRSCMMVGVRSTSSGNAPFSEHWGGRTWHVTGTPSLPGFDNGLGSVDCPSSSNCVAVGATQVQTASQAGLVERWDGKSWSAERVPGSTNGALQSVSCGAPGDCWAVGDTAITSRQQSPLIVHIGKSGDSVAHSPVGSGIVGSVSCPTTSTCWAVGNDGRGPFLIGLRNGSWKSFAGADRYGEIRGISCATATDCSAVGMQSGPFQSGPWAGIWDGTSWTQVGSPTVTGSFAAVSCPATTVCFAAGYTGQGLGSALVARSQR